MVRMSEVGPGEGDIRKSREKIEEQTPRLEDLQSGDVIRFADIAELAAFEDMLAGVVAPKHDPELWAARTHLREHIKPPKYHGNIMNIELTVMEDPYKRLLDARERGWSSSSREMRLDNVPHVSPELAAGYLPKFKGFTLTAEPRSSQPGLRGQQIQAELWYFPLKPDRHKEEEN